MKGAYSIILHINQKSHPRFCSRIQFFPEVFLRCFSEGLCEGSEGGIGCHEFHRLPSTSRLTRSFVALGAGPVLTTELFIFSKHHCKYYIEEYPEQRGAERCIVKQC